MDALADFVNRVFRGRATWHAERDPRSRATRFGFQCDRRTPVFSLSDNLLEDVADARSTAELILDKCVDVYGRHHQLLALSDPSISPIATCHECRSYVTLDDERRMTSEELYQHCESQAVRWMERAVQVRSKL